MSKLRIKDIIGIYLVLLLIHFLLKSIIEGQTRSESELTIDELYPPHEYVDQTAGQTQTQTAGQTQTTGQAQHSWSGPQYVSHTKPP